jgi:hypothetical protein
LVNFNDCFKDAERPTSINIGLFVFVKPVVTNYDFELIDQLDEEEIGSGLVKYTEARALCGEYKQVLITKSKIHAEIKNLSNLGIKIDLANVTSYETINSLYWRKMLNLMPLDGRVTDHQRNKIEMILSRSNMYPLTMANAKYMFELIIGTLEYNYSEALVQIVDYVLKYSDKSTLKTVEVKEKFKTNKAQMLGDKFIFGWGARYSEWAKQIEFNGSSIYSNLKDLSIVIANLLGDSKPNIFIHPYDKFDSGQWYAFSNYFQIKAFKKGTVHVIFHDSTIVEKLNRKYASIKGWQLPEKF